MSEFRDLKLTDLVTSTTNPRTEFEENSLKELAESIKEHGVLQPIIVRPHPKQTKKMHYEIVCGERRFRASKIAEMETIPASVRELSDDEVFELQIIENLERKDVHPLDEASAFKRMIESGKYSQANYKRWENEKYPEGFIKTQFSNGKQIVKIKVDGEFIPYARYRYQQLYGPIPEGYKVRFIDCNPLNISDENLSIYKGGLTKEERELYRENLKKNFSRRTKVLTPEMEKYIVRNAKSRSIKNMTKHLGVSDSVIKGVLSHHKIAIPKELIQKFRIEAMTGRTTFTPSEDKFIKENYLKLPIKKIGKHLNRSYSGINKRIEQLGLVIPDEIREERRIKGMYRKGHTPANKGKKMSEETREKSKHTWFKKGQIPTNAVPDWEERIRNDNTGRKYIMIKLPGERKLKHKHIWLWEKFYQRKLQPGFNIVFKNGNTMDLRIENLECISDAELMKRNSFHRFPEDLRKVIQMKGALKRQINKIEKQQNNG